MTAKSSNQVGIGAILIIAVALGLAVVVGASLFVANNRVERNSAGAAATIAPPKVTDPKATSAKQSKPGTYELFVKEWGVTVPLPESMKDVYYVVSTSSAAPDGTPNTIWLGSKSITSCAAENGNKGRKALASIIRVGTNDTEPVSGKRYVETYPNGLAIGDYYYAYGAWSKDNTCTTGENFKKFDDALKPAIKQAKKAN